MHVADVAVRIHNAIQRHTPKLEKIDFLLVRLCNKMIWIGQSDKRNIFFCPIFFELRQSIWPDGKNLCAARNELRIMVTHTRQLRAAVWSHEAAQKGKQNGFAAAKAGEADGISVYVVEIKIRSMLTGGYQVWVHRFSKYVVTASMN